MKEVKEINEFRVSLLAYSPMAMGILSGKYFSSGGAPSDARLNIFRGKITLHTKFLLIFFPVEENCWTLITCYLLQEDIQKVNLDTSFQIL